MNETRMVQGKAEHVRWVRHEGEIDFQPLLVEFANTQRNHTESLATLELHSRCRLPRDQSHQVIYRVLLEAPFGLANDPLTPYQISRQIIS